MVNWLTARPPSEVGRANVLVQNLITTGIDFFFPPRCVVCRCAGSFFCRDCQGEIPFPPIQPRNAPALDGIYTTAIFEGAIREVIHGLKYEGTSRLAQPLGQRLAMTYADLRQQNGASPTLITAVPIHDSRLRKRGYNQAALLAEALGRLIGHSGAVRLDVIQRLRDTAPQVALTATERTLNVADAFHADESAVKGETILLIDDVFTTGATLSACAEALRHAGAAAVYGLTVAAASG